MGCTSSVDQAAGDAATGGFKKRPLTQAVSARSAQTGRRAYEEVSVAESAPLSQWEAGYLLDDETAGPVNALEDYRGFAVTMSTNASKNKASAVCRWADAALEAQEKNGGVFFDPQNPSVWPSDLLSTYKAYFSDQFADTGLAQETRKHGTSGGKHGKDSESNGVPHDSPGPSVPSEEMHRMPPVPKLKKSDLSSIGRAKEAEKERKRIAAI